MKNQFPNLNQSGFLILTLPLALCLLSMLTAMSFTLKIHQESSSSLHRCRKLSLETQAERRKAIEYVLEMNPQSRAIAREIKMKTRLYDLALKSRIPKAIVAAKAALQEAKARQAALAAIQKMRVQRLLSLDQRFAFRARQLAWQSKWHGFATNYPKFPLRPKAEVVFPEYELIPNFTELQTLGMTWRQEVKFSLGPKIFKMKTWENQCLATITQRLNKTHSVALKRDKSFLKL